MPYDPDYHDQGHPGFIHRPTGGTDRAVAGALVSIFVALVAVALAWVISHL